MDTSVTVPDTWIYKCDCTGYLDTQVWLYRIPGSTSVSVPDLKCDYTGYLDIIIQVWLYQILGYTSVSVPDTWIPGYLDKQMELYRIPGYEIHDIAKMLTCFRKSDFFKDEINLLFFWKHTQMLCFTETYFKKYQVPYCMFMSVLY